MLHHKKPRKLGITRKATGNNLEPGILPLFRTTQCLQLGVSCNFGSPHLKKDTPELEEVLRNDCIYKVDEELSDENLKTRILFYSTEKIFRGKSGA